MNNYLKKTLLTIFLISLFGCQSKLNEYSHTTPTLALEHYFDGPITAWGLVQDYSNKVTRRFCVEMIGTWQGNSGVLAETFYFDDGEVSTRNWHLTKQANNKYSGVAEDVIGEATGETQGFAARWQYTLSLKINDSSYQFTLDDWLFQVDQYRAFNRAKMKKFGINVAELTLFFDKQQPLRQCQN